ncbi:MAG: hypothetical protein B1H03_01865 [Planctomycetales bacterium 4484_113]|nr:MAG: hypothetical protein B1H03_01865 [Planctomycetales bacterium 4484_113]
MPVFIKTFGCKVNYADSVELAGKLIRAGVECALLERAKLPEPDRRSHATFIVNACAVTAEAVAKARRFCRRLLRLHPDARVLVTGCGARAEEIAAEFLALGVPVRQRMDEVVALLAGEDDSGKGRGEAKTKVPVLSGRARYFLKVQDGCNGVCSYCIIPRVRHRESKSWCDIRLELESVLASGVPEVVVTGINLGLYSDGDTGWGLAELLQNMLRLVPESSRLRLSSVEPEHIDERLLALFEHPRMCPHLHLPLQSGSDAVLRSMRRKYTAQQYLDIVREFRRRYPRGAVSSDLMVGYPTESRDDFEQTLAIVRACGFERVHIFRFSRRPGTAAVNLEPLPAEEVKEREHRLFTLADAVSAHALARYLGGSCDVAVEARSEPALKGYGEAYQRVSLRIPPDLSGPRLLPVQLKALKDGVFLGSPRR